MLLFRGRAPFDEVIFRSPDEFVVDIEYDPEFLGINDNEPVRSPFGWAHPQSSKLYGGPSDPDLNGLQVVTGVFAKDDDRKDLQGNDVKDTKPSDFKFYKVTVWQNGLKLDPCFFCDR
jgi:hypothetical protein